MYYLKFCLKDIFDELDEGYRLNKCVSQAIKVLFIQVFILNTPDTSTFLNVCFSPCNLEEVFPEISTVSPFRESEIRPT